MPTNTPTIAIIGGTGLLGRQLLSQGLQRGYRLRAIARHADSADLDPRVEKFRAADSDREELLRALSGADIAMPIFPPSLQRPQDYPQQIRNVLDAAKAAGATRVVGLIGSAGARVATGERLFETDYFQETTRHFYEYIAQAWDVYREARSIDWTVIVPAARLQLHLQPRGTYRTRTDGYLVVTEDGSRRYFDVSQISYADCAQALLDEVRDRRFFRQFVSIGY